MINPLVDEIQALSDCRSHGERAQWLLSVPLSVLSHYEMTIRNRLQIAGFHDGVDYLEHELKVFRLPRCAGLFDYGADWAKAKARMLEIAVGPYILPDLDGPPTPDHSLTDI